MDSEDDVDGTLQSFMFGNIDESGHLENDIFDEESKQHLSSLSNFGLGSLVRELVDLEETNELAISNEFQEKSENAVDYSDINEAVADADVDEGAEADREAAGSVEQMPASQAARDGEERKDEDLKPMKEPSPPVDKQSARTVQNVNTPLAGMLPPELAHYNVHELFPDFSQDRVLRFQRLFRPTYEPVTYKIKKKKKLVPPTSQPELKQESSLAADPKVKTDGGLMDTVNGRSMSAAAEGDNIEEASGEEHDEVVEDERDWGGFNLKLGRSPRPEEVLTNDAVLLTRPSNISADSGTDGSTNAGKPPEVPYWRHGPAKLWYDMMDVPETGEGFDYGFRLKPEEGCEEEPSDLPAPPMVEYPLDTFLSVNLVHWEEHCYYDPNDKDQRESLARLEKQKMPYCAWHPSTSLRTFEQFVKQRNPNLYTSLADAGYFNRTFAFPKPGGTKAGSQAADSTSKKLIYSIMPVESSELLYERWEDDIILDTQNMIKIPKPPDCAIDPYDENVVFEIPDDNEPSTPEQTEQETKKEKEVKKSKAIQDKVGLLKDKENDQEERDDTPIQNKDPWNLSESEIYLPKNSANQPISGNLGVSIIEHSTPAVELRAPFFPTHMTTAKLRYFHRPTLRRYQHHGIAGSTNAYPLLSLTKLIKRKEAQREMERIASGGGEMFFMRTPDDLTDNFYGAGKRRLETRVCGFGDIFFMRTTEDLTGKDGELILAEFSEQYPPLMNQIGMATKIKNYYKRKPGNDSDPPAYKYGEMAYAHTSRFLGSLLPGQCLQAFENNMYRAPSYEHRVPETDLLVIRNRTEFYAREVETIFVVGQECPLIEVPGPNSKRANNFVRDFLQVFIYRLFWKSRDVPRRIKMEEIRMAFPTHSENTIRKRLKQCADFKRTGVDSNWWVQNSNFRLPTEQEISQMVTPEQCCAYYAMLAAEQRLKDAGYGEKSLLQDEENDEETQTKMEDEVKAAPWNTTRAFIAAMKGRCLLDLNGVADPTGCGEGFSFVSVPNKPQQAKDDAMAHTPVKRTVTGTDADLRRLPLKEAKQLLRKFGVSEDKIKKLSRWEVINLVRTESTKQSKASMEGFGNSAIGKFARGNRFSVAEHRERYKEECQRIFDLQNRMLGSDEVLSTDEESDSEVAECEEFGRNLETMLCDGKTSSQMKHLREEAGRKELNKMLRDNAGKDKNDKKKNEEAKLADANKGQRILKITRTFRNESGGEFTRTEIVRNQQVCDRYIKIRQTKDPEQIKQFAVNEQQKEEMRKEKRRIQEQLRRCKRMEDIKSGAVMPPPAKKRKKELNPESAMKLQKIKCRACGQVGHMKTNRDCPMFNKFKMSALVGKVALSEEQEEQLTKSDLVDRDLIISEGTKIKVSRHLVEHTEQVKHQALVLKLPKLMSESKKRRRAGKEVQLDYLKKASKLANRRRADPLVTLSSIFENIVKEMKELPNAKIFHHPVSAKYVPDYYVHIKKPMDLQTIVNNIRSRKYISRELFIVDVSLIVKNSEVYNGPKSGLTLIAQTMLDFCLQRVTEKEEKIMSLEKAINPMLDVDLVSFGYILSGIVELRMKTVEGSIPFHHPVNKKQCKDYYEVIDQPMDLSTLYKRAKENKYHSQEQFLRDVQLIVSNCEKYNGPNSTLSKTAHRLLDVCKDAMKEQEDTLRQLEKNILAVQEAAMEGVETESVVTATSVTGGDTESVAAHSAKGGHGTENFDREHLEHDDGDNLSHDDPEDFDRLMRMEEFVDVEDAPDDDMKNLHQINDDEDQVEDSLEQDLHMTPERSSDLDDDEELDDSEMRSPTPKRPKLSSSGSDSEPDEDRSSQANAIDAELSQYAEQVQQSNAMYRFDENAQDFSYDAVYTTTVGDDENSFDPQAFFSELVQQDGTELHHDETGEVENLEADVGPEAVTDINNDLEVSDSDDSTPELVTLEDDDDSDQDFNMGDFLNME